MILSILAQPTMIRRLLGANLWLQTRPTHPDIQPQLAADQAYLARVQLQVGGLKHFLFYKSYIPVFHGGGRNTNEWFSEALCCGERWNGIVREV